MKKINWGTFFVFGVFFFFTFGFALAPFWLIFGIAMILFGTFKNEPKKSQIEPAEESGKIKLELEKEKIRIRNNQIHDTRIKEWKKHRADFSYWPWLKDGMNHQQSFYYQNPLYYMDLVHATKDELEAAGMDQVYLAEVEKRYLDAVNELKENLNPNQLKDGEIRPEYEFFKCWSKMLTDEQIMKMNGDRDEIYKSVLGMED